VQVFALGSILLNELQTKGFLEQIGLIFERNNEIVLSYEPCIGRPTLLTSS
jgi:hypothetical protein